MLLDADVNIVILKPTQKCVDWITQLPPSENSSYSPVTLFEAQNDATTLLMPKFDNENEAIEYLEEIYEELFENELSSWYDDEDYWPQERDFETFLEWFEIEQHSIVYDCCELFENDNY